ncbi:hypothetical protein BXZ70DRAFT_890445 [Cristinia sonorae]|uniref:Glycosyltransferase family 32 protein n=1 Tax=Cristinia sonorae TaxID=1940300 RepID=A0A8K0UT20_9AGAR|nr:hypothetical protein BXZ70DRAFT_890445 [Cristinia sonorae]
MAASVYFPQRTNGLTQTNGNGLPVYSGSSAVHEKRARHKHSQSSWLLPITLPIPGVRTRRLRLMAPNPLRLLQASISRFGRTWGPIVLVFSLVATAYAVFALHNTFATEGKTWSTPFPLGEPPTLVFRREDLQRIWEWEVAAGHYPSSQKIPEQIGLTKQLVNPALPAHRINSLPSRFRTPTVIHTLGTGSSRVYLDIQSTPPDVAYPPRPVQGSIADMDIVMRHCDFSDNKYVRDCLEVLRLGGGLDAGKRVRRGKMDNWKYIYVENGEGENSTESGPFVVPAAALKTQSDTVDANNGLYKKHGVDWEASLRLPSPPPYISHIHLPTVCDDENPRVFHMFWTGPFTDKPYLALLSFLFTQNIGLHLERPDPNICRPQFWLWINPGPAAAVPNPSALSDMFDQLKNNPWASPFLHPRFKDVIQFKLWNTTDQLDNIDEIKDEWRSLGSLFNSGGWVENVPAPIESKADKNATKIATDAAEEATDGEEVAPTSTEDDKLNRVGSKSPSSYDRLSVILSDMARFILTHRYGGIYLDADTLFLRDWEEIWGWRGAFAYRWSRLERYNTAVLKLNKRSALGSFLFRTALKNGMDFHPMTVARYTKDAHLEGLLLRLPDALFDSAWLNTEQFQIDRPPQPFFTSFGDFFETPVLDSAAPQALGFDGFFKGAYSYHFHNFWWQPFDPSRNYPDLGQRFEQGDSPLRHNRAHPDLVSEDKRDLDWSTVLKRTFESYIRGERPNMYGEWLRW